MNRWAILGVLFVARMAMAFQFQSVAALSPLMLEVYGLTLVDIGLLIGLYLAPGIVVAIPGGVLAARIGDKRIVGWSLVLMLAGGALLAWAPGDWALGAGRVLAGIGGVVVNVVMTKMVVDWFAGREISTAMAVFVNSWPVGIALALATLPWVATLGGLGAAWGTVLAIVGIGLVLFALGYRAPAQAASGPTVLAVRAFPVAPLVFAGAIWALYNGALAMVFGFGPALLTERGLDGPSASGATSLFMFALCLTVPLGGIVADRLGRPGAVIAAGLAGFALLLPLTVLVPPGWAVAVLVAAGLLVGLPAGPAMGLPATFLAPEARAFAMGVFFTIYYVWMMAAPPLAGLLSDAIGSAGAAMGFGVVMCLAALACLAAFFARPRAG
ncbi:CynX/NimT family MFS transporter [Jannaschia seohaensis]|uniref:Predicted arabinose efflux permease, MFS family n=1 Tax=Jannaschia seohaensis TaxID=475081 RepID=A0A2Y9C285_9RHOB|nr:MFS transporter [Jannaschia seohaensis]PWJ16218.1 putative MFS family arabinose efflux permease [Jannaschia seohaensis]SSA49262.1 Predicted arabinose efflux permease, MFS family [Jannaschia seohaensis]